MDHPYYEKYRDTETQRQRRIQAALKRREYAREMVQREFVATQRQLRLALAVNFYQSSLDFNCFHRRRNGRYGLNYVPVKVH